MPQQMKQIAVNASAEAKITAAVSLLDGNGRRRFFAFARADIAIVLTDESFMLSKEENAL